MTRDCTNNLKITVLVDNRSISPNLLAAWGLSLLIETDDDVLLFDTGPEWEILKRNALALGVKLLNIRRVIISHWHGDHSGGLRGLISYLRRKHRVPYIVAPEFRAGYNKILVPDGPSRILKGIATTGPLGDLIKEQALVVRVCRYGLVVIVGCTHPGVEEVLSKVSSMSEGEPIIALVGGLHLTLPALETLLDCLRRYEVRAIAPAHCTGDALIKALSVIYGKGFLRMYVGRLLSIPQEIQPLL